MKPVVDDLSKPTASRSSGAAAAVTIIVLVVLLPLLYILSIGPVVWLESRGYIEVQDDSLLVTFYWPLLYSAHEWEFVGTIFESYVELWSAPAR